MSDNQKRLEGLNDGDERILGSGAGPNQAPSAQTGAPTGSETNAEKLAKLQAGQSLAATTSSPATPSGGPTRWGTAGSTPVTMPAIAAHKKRNGILIAAGGFAVLLIAIGLAVINSGSGDATSGETGSNSVAPASQGTLVEAPVAVDRSSADLFEKPASIPDTVARVTASTALLYCAGSDGDYQGSGFVLDPSPLTGSSQPIIVTNEHVVADCESPVEVVIDERTYQGTVHDTDKDMDLAIIDVDGLTATPLKAALDPQIGQWVMTLGAPEGITGTSSFGTITNYKAAEYFITTDAVIGQGSSGGPLLNSREEVVGVNSAYIPESSGIAIAMSLRGLCVSLLTCK